jgi:hypothetical protein
MVLDSHRSILATGRAASACARGYRVRFHRVTQLVTSLIEARDELTILGLRARLAELDLLVLDELGSRGTRPRRMRGRDIALSILPRTGGGVPAWSGEKWRKGRYRSADPSSTRCILVEGTCVLAHPPPTGG